MGILVACSPDPPEKISHKKGQESGRILVGKLEFTFSPIRRLASSFENRRFSSPEE